MNYYQKFLNNVVLTQEENYQVIEHLINESRRVYNVSEDNLMMCQECCRWICFKLIKMGYPFNYNYFNTTQLGFNKTFHYFCVIEFNTDEGLKSFVIDPVFEQFNTNNYKFSDKIVIDSKKEFNNDFEFLNNLSNRKYLELTDENIEKYILGLTNFGNKCCNYVNPVNSVNRFKSTLIKNNIEINKQIT